MTLQKRNDETLVQGIVQRLEEGIISGDFVPNERLDEQKLAARFGASRTPVREALRHLAAAGLIEVRPHKGAVVAEIPVPRMIQMFEVMSELEGLCARLSARRMTTAERRKLRVIYEESVDALQEPDFDLDRFHMLGLQFHDAIYIGSHNPFLQETTRNLRMRTAAYRRHSAQQPGRAPAASKEHGSILNAIESGDAERADEVMRRHLNIQSEIFMDFITTMTASEVMAGNWR